MEMMMEQGWWRQRTKLERRLVVLEVLALIVIAALAIALIVILVNHQSEVDDVCLTAGCATAASMVIKKMDLTVEPCDDFYSYACGSYLRTASIPDEKTYIDGSYDEISDLLQQQLRSIIEEPESSSDSRPITLAKHIYKACMNETAIEARGLEPVNKILRQLHGWPVLEGGAWKTGLFEWKNLMYKLRRIGLQTDFLINLSVDPDSKNSTHRKITLDVASLGLSHEYLVKGFNDHSVDSYYKYMVDIAVLFGSDRRRATSELKQSLEFEMALANISPPKEERRDFNVLYNPMIITELQTKYPSIPWLEYFNNLLPPKVSVGNRDVVVVAVPNYISNLEKLLKNTDKRVMANYCMWRVVQSLVEYLTQAVQDRTLQYSTTLTGQVQEDPRWKTCIDLVSNRADIALGSIYVTRIFDKTSKKAITDVVVDIQHTFQQMITKLDWMDEGTKQRALAKAKSMNVHIAYPDELLDVDKVAKFYEKLFVNEELYLETILNITLFETDYTFGLLHTAVNKTEWIQHADSVAVNAYYDPMENSIRFPAVILQGAFFGSDRPKYTTYGAIGNVIGHEITHGFDDQGRLYDDSGNLVDWWEQETKEKFLTRATCIVNQYANYSDKSTGLTLNGVNTQGENIADNGGLKAAYLAYTEWSKRSGQTEPRLPGLVSLSPHQMFWVSAAQIWCSKHRVEDLTQLITTDEHAPGEFRVIGPMANMEDFARDFHCPLGSNMNPATKCQVW